MNKMQKKAFLREDYELLHMWQAAVAVILGIYAITPVKIGPLASEEGFCVLVYAALACLYLMVTITGNAYWIHGITAEMTEQAGISKVRIFGIKNILVYLCATAAYLCYCVYARSAPSRSSIYSAIAGAVVLTAAVVISGSVSLLGKKN